MRTPVRSPRIRLLSFDQRLRISSHHRLPSSSSSSPHPTPPHLAPRNEALGASKDVLACSHMVPQDAMVSRLKHDNLVELLGYCDDRNLRVLAYEYATMGSLRNVLHGWKDVQGAQPGPPLNWVQRVRIAADAAKGLEYLREKVQPSIIHRDIRSSSVLLFEDFKAKIADFNLLNKPPEMLEAVAAVCVQCEADFRPNIWVSYVVKALQPLLLRKPVAPAPAAALCEENLREGAYLSITSPAFGDSPRLRVV